jgi:lysozyme family protein
MTEQFKKVIIPWIFKWEGTTYENDPDDPGNDGTKYRGTKYGIDARSHPKVDIRNLTAEQAMEIYWNKYWLKFKCNEIKWPMSFVWFNCCVNCGLQRAKEIFKIAGNNPKKFLDEQKAFYVRLAKARPTSQKFLKGWLNRTNDLSKQIGLA